MIAQFSSTVKFITPASFYGRGGEAIHGWVVNELSKLDPKFAKRLHEGRYTQPFSVSPLLIKKGKVNLDEGILYIAEGSYAQVLVTGLDKEICEMLNEMFENLANRKSPIKLGNGKILVENYNISKTGIVLNKDFLKKLPPSNIIDFRILTPMTFRRSEINISFPLPELIFSSLFRIWNAFSKVRIPMSFRVKFQNIAVSKYKLTTELWHFSTYKLIGCKGDITYILEKGFTDEDRRYICALARLAEFSGVGHKRTMGMGMVEVRLKQLKP